MPANPTGARKAHRENSVPSVPSCSVPAVHVPAEVVPLGDGSYRVTPRKPSVEVQEISTREACRILNIGRAQIWYDRDSLPGSKILKWRFSGPGQGKILWELPSVLAYKSALKELGK